MRAVTFFADKPAVEVEIIAPMQTKGMFRVKYNFRELVRHRDRLQPLDDEARKVLGKK